MRNYSVVIVACALLLGSCSGAGRSRNLFELYMQHERDILACESVECYREVTKRYSSNKTLETLSSMTENATHAMFVNAKERAAHSLREQELYVDSEIVKGAHVTLVLKHRKFAFYRETLPFSREGGTWKIGQ